MSSTSDTPQKPEPSTTTYTGSCHCGSICYKVTTTTLEETEVVNCNCTICVRNGYLLVYCPPDAVTFEKGGEDSLTEYRFNKGVIAHQFCPTCGSSVIATAKEGSAMPGWRAINVRCLDGVIPEELKLKPYDGKKI